jgi:hypothetical protein
MNLNHKHYNFDVLCTPHEPLPHHVHNGPRPVPYVRLHVQRGGLYEQGNPAPGTAGFPPFASLPSVKPIG